MAGPDFRVWGSGLFPPETEQMHDSQLRSQSHANDLAALHDKAKALEFAIGRSDRRKPRHSREIYPARRSPRDLPSRISAALLLTREGYQWRGCQRV